MKKWGKRTLWVAVVAMLVLVIPVWANGGNTSPGSANDPIVSKSYVDQAIQQLRQELGSQVSVQPQPQPSGTGQIAVQVLELQPGQVVYGKEGTQFIVRTGKVKVIAGAQGDGIPDLTSGTDLKGNQQVETNHLLLIPRSDQRGLKVTSDSPSSAFIIVIGDYE